MLLRWRLGPVIAPEWNTQPRSPRVGNASLPLRTGDLDALGERFAADFIRHRSPLPDMVGLDALKQSIVNLRGSYPDMQFAIDEMIVEGETSAFRWTFSGTQTGPSPTAGEPPSGEEVMFTGCIVSHWEGGKIVEELAHNNRESVLKRFGYPPVG